MGKALLKSCGTVRAFALVVSEHPTPQTADKTGIRRSWARLSVGCFNENDEQQPDREQPLHRSRIQICHSMGLSSREAFVRHSCTRRKGCTFSLGLGSESIAFPCCGTSSAPPRSQLCICMPSDFRLQNDLKACVQDCRVLVHMMHPEACFTMVFQGICT